MDIVTRGMPQYADMLDRIGHDLDDGRYVIVPRALMGHPRLQSRDFWLRSSRRGDAWVLGHTARGGDLRFVPAALLHDPPRRDGGTIGQILLHAFVACAEDDTLSRAHIDEIVRSLPFPSFRTLASYLPEAPAAWRDLPVTLSVSVGMSEGIALSSTAIDEFEHDSLNDVLDVVCGDRIEGLTLHYTLEAQEVVPLLGWDADWPLARRGRDRPSRRGHVQGTVPWESAPDTTLLEIYQSVPCDASNLAIHLFARHRVRLRVGGRDEAGAIANWHVCARALRALIRRARTARD